MPDNNIGRRAFIEVEEYHYETWPAAHEDILKPADFVDEFEDADPGYSIVCFSLIDPHASPEEIEACDIAGCTQRRDVIEWSCHGVPEQRDDELRAVIESPLEYPEELHHVLGFVYPDGTVLINEGARLRAWTGGQIACAPPGVGSPRCRRISATTTSTSTKLPPQAPRRGAGGLAKGKVRWKSQEA